MLAVGALVAGYAGLMAWTQEPPPAAAKAQDLHVGGPELPLPEPLDPLRPAARPVDAMARAQPFPLERRRSRLLVDVAPGAPRGAGVAVLDADSRAVLAWRSPLPGAADAMNGVAAPATIEFESLPAGAHFVALALAPELARWSWLAQARVENDAVPARVTLPTATQAVTVEVADANDEPVADAILTLDREDAPNWMWMLPAPADRDDGFTARDLAFTGSDGTFTFAPLGPGRYRVRVDAAPPDAGAAFAVPGPVRVKVQLPAR